MGKLVVITGYQNEFIKEFDWSSVALYGKMDRWKREMKIGWAGKRCRSTGGGAEDSE